MDPDTWYASIYTKLDKDTMEEVEKMDLSQEKMQLRYHSADEADAIWKNAEKIAIKLLDVLDVETIAEKTNLTVKRVQALKKSIKNNGGKIYGE